VEQFDEEGKAIEGGYRINVDGTVTRIIDHEAQRPNGIAISADGKYLIVADNHNGPELGGQRMLLRFDLNDDGSVNLAGRKVLYDWGKERGPDGIAIGPDGHIYATAGLNFASSLETAAEHLSGVYIISIEGGEARNNSRSRRYYYQLYLWRRRWKDIVHHRRRQTLECSN